MLFAIKRKRNIETAYLKTIVTNKICASYKKAEAHFNIFTFCVIIGVVKIQNDYFRGGSNIKLSVWCLACFVLGVFYIIYIIGHCSKQVFDKRFFA